MTTTKRNDDASSGNTGPGRVQPGVDTEKEKPETDHSRAGKGSGASGGGSFGNLPGKAETGGSPEFGPRERQSQGPVTDRTASERKNEKD
jgi:hypothetical protein